METILIPGSPSSNFQGASLIEAQGAWPGRMSETYISAELRRLTRNRAAECCEYCLIPEAVSLLSHQIDHVIAEKHGGRTDEDNLALSCALCNRRKASDIASVDPQTDLIEPLFHPRRDRWEDHFRLVAGRIEPVTATGRTKVRLLQLNATARIEERRLLISIGILRPPAP